MYNIINILNNKINKLWEIRREYTASAENEDGKLSAEKINAGIYHAIDLLERTKIEVNNANRFKNKKL